MTTNGKENMGRRKLYTLQAGMGTSMSNAEISTELTKHQQLNHIIPQLTTVHTHFVPWNRSDWSLSMHLLFFMGVFFPITL